MVILSKCSDSKQNLPETVKIEEAFSVEQMAKKAKASLKREEICLDDFEGIYTKEKIEADKKYVEEKEKVFDRDDTENEKEMKKLATIFEVVVYKHGELSEWFGHGALTIKTSEYDDIKNGVDLMVEFEEKGHLALAIDVTFSNDTEKKFERIQKEIEKGKLTEVEYFKSESEEYPHSLQKVPRVVIGAEKKTVMELGELWVENEKEKLGKHSIQFQMLDQIIEQAEVFAEYARKCKKEDVVGQYENIRKILGDVLKEKNKNPDLEDSFERDNVHYSIIEKAKSFKNF